MTHPLAAAGSIDSKPAAWLVAGGIVSAVTVLASCLAILIH